VSYLPTNLQQLLFAAPCLPFTFALAVVLALGLLELLALGLGLGSVPTSALLALLVGWFAISGLCMQAVQAALFGGYLPTLRACVQAACLSVPLAHGSARLLSRVLPSDESSAVSRSSFVGSVATMLQAPAHAGHAAQAKLHDGFGQPHYVLVEPEHEGETLAAGCEVLLVRQCGAGFRAIENPHPALSPRRT
jgi:hypothetical protein